MKIVKRYADGRFYEPEKKKYLRKEELARRLSGREKIQVLQSKSGQDVTREVARGLGVDSKRKSGRLPSADALKKWLADNKKWLDESIDKRIERVMSVLNLPSREQIVRLTAGIEALSEKIRELENVNFKNHKAAETRENPPKAGSGGEQPQPTGS